MKVNSFTVATGRAIEAASSTTIVGTGIAVIAITETMTAIGIATAASHAGVLRRDPQ
jgi:hypothetical protein